MGKKWSYRLKTEDFAYAALECRSEDKREALTEYYSESESDPKLVGIRTELEAAYAEKTPF